MSNEKIKVKELATELDKQSKDVLAAAKELGILSAKVAGSNISGEEAARIRTHLGGGDVPEKQDVIVRRRKKAPAEKKTAPVETAEAAPQGDEGADASQAEPEAKTETQPVESAQKAEEATPAPVEAKPQGAKIVTPARVVAPAAKVVEPALAEEAQVSVSNEEQASVTNAAQTSAANTAQASASNEEQASVSNDVQASAGNETTEKESPKEAPATEKTTKPATASEKSAEKTVEETPTAARVVSPAEFSAEPERDAAGAPVSSAPAMAAKGDASAEAQAPAAESSTQVRVISRPDPAVVRERKENEARQGRDQRPARDGGRPARDSGRGGAPRDGGRDTRPARPGGGRPDFTPAAPAGPAGDDSRGKKRSKGRRTVDFTSKRNENEDSAWSKVSGRRKGRGKQVEAPKGGTQPQKAVKRKIRVEEFIRVSDLAHQMGLKAGEIIKNLFNLGVMATINQSLDVETATLVAMEFGYEIEKVGFSEEEFIEAQHQVDDPESLRPRPPVVTIMGHVDHGKTSLLDALRKSSVVTGEAGGITQHIGAYHVTTKKGEIVFLDTPGHEAFTAMRARGAEVTDIVVLVVAADDGVMEQTREAINHAKEANVPIMVAVNKIDKPAAEPERVKRELAENGIVAEDWGGDIVFAHVSAKTGEGLEELLDLLVLQADLLELKVNPDKPAIGRIIEAKLDKGRGSLATVLIQQGTLRQGDAFVCGIHAGRVRAMLNDQGQSVKEATPSMPVVVQGFEGVPEAGEEFVCVADERTARRIAESRAIKQRERELARESKVTLETFLASRASDVEAAVLKLVIKADVQGTLEAVIDAVTKLSTDQVKVQVVHGGAGAISESDILLATAANGIAIGFNVRPTVKAKELAELEKVEIRFYDVIYKLVEEIQSAMEGLLAPIEREVVLGTAEVRDTFSVPKVGTIAGCHVLDGKILRNASVRLLRDGVVIHTGKIASLRRFKDDVREVLKGYECGIGIDGYNDVKVGDNIEAFEIVEEAAKL